MLNIFSLDCNFDKLLSPNKFAWTLVTRLGMSVYRPRHESESALSDYVAAIPKVHIIPAFPSTAHANDVKHH